MKSIKQIEIKSSSDHLWSVLTESSFTQQYMYNCKVDSSWEVGGSVVWEGKTDGYETYQKGEVIKFIPGQQLTYSTFDPNQNLPDLPENYIHVTYTIHELNDECQLTITNETFDDNLERLSQINLGWDVVALSIKKVAEQVGRVA